LTGRVPSIHFMAHARSAFRLLFLVFAITATVAHICVLPDHVHAAPPVTENHGHDEPATDRHDAPSDSFYVESCDALQPSSFVPVPPSPAAVATVSTLVEIACHAVDRAVDGTPPRASPPLYLIHRTLRI
jgi:hypothetical protein